MFAVAWKETLSNGSQPIRMKQFRTEDARADFIDTLRDNGVSFQITSMNSCIFNELIFVKHCFIFFWAINSICGSTKL